MKIKHSVSIAMFSFFMMASTASWGMDIENDKKVIAVVSKIIPDVSAHLNSQPLPPYHTTGRYLFSEPLLDVYQVLVAAKKKELDAEKVESLLVKASDQGNEVAQMQLYKYYTLADDPMGLKNPIKEGLLLKKAIGQKKLWAYKKQAELERSDNEKLKLHKFLAKRGEKTSIEFVNKSLQVPYSYLLLQPLGFLSNTLTLDFKIDQRSLRNFIGACNETDFTYPIIKILLELDRRLEGQISQEEEQVIQALSKILVKEGALLKDVNCMFSYALKMEDERNDREMLKWLKAAASDGFVEAIAKLTNYYFLKDNFKEALSWGEQAAQMGNFKSMYLCGVMLQCQKHFQKACCYFLEGSKGGDQKPFFKAGVLLHSLGKKTESLEIFKTLGDMGHSESAYNAGNIYKQLNNSKTAKQWYKKALKLGYTGFDKLGPEDIYSKLWKLYVFERKISKALTYFQLERKLQPLEAKFYLSKILAYNNYFFESYELNNEAAAEGHPFAIIVQIVDALVCDDIKGAAFWLERGLALEEENRSLFSEIQKCVDLCSETPLFDFENWINELISSALTSTQVNLEERKEEIKPLNTSLNTEVPALFDKKNSPPKEKRKEGLNAKGMREKKRLDNLQLEKLKKQQTEKTQAFPKCLEKQNQKIADTILQGDAPKLEQEDIIKLFSDPFFQNKVYVRKNAAGGLTIVAYDARTKACMKTGGHKIHGQENFVGNLHPQLVKDIIEILKNWNITKR